MSAKKTKDQFILEAIAKHGDKYDYSKVEYEGRNKEVIILCKQHGGEFNQKPSNHLSSGCSVCSGKKTLEGFNDLQTKNPKLAKEWHPTKNVDLKPTDVTSSSNKIVWWLGECGHEWEASVKNRSKGTRCLDCFGNKKKTFKYVKEQIEIEGFKLLSDSYEKAHQKLQIKCPNGHEYKVTWGSWQQGTRCKDCKGLKKHSYQDVKNHFESEGYILFSDSYGNNKQKLQVSCPNGHSWEVSRGSFFFQKNSMLRMRRQQKKDIQIC